MSENSFYATLEQTGCICYKLTKQPSFTILRPNLFSDLLIQQIFLTLGSAALAQVGAVTENMLPYSP